jgi:hypothetical protein
MKREKTKQKNFRLTESLIEDLEKVTDELPGTTLTDIAVTGIGARVRTLKKRIEQRKESEGAVA